MDFRAEKQKYIIIISYKFLWKEMWILGQRNKKNIIIIIII